MAYSKLEGEQQSPHVCLRPSAGKEREDFSYLGALRALRGGKMTKTGVHYGL